jgi:hypothetical protein
MMRMNYRLVIFDAWIIVPGITVQTRDSWHATDSATPFRASHAAPVAVPQGASESKPVICGCFIVLSGKPACAYPK